jgi:prepilin-type N-terminal cleavage/methylation domain-containing protein
MKVRALTLRRRLGERQFGFTLAELMVAIAVGAIIIVGTMVLFRHMVTVSAQHRNETMATLQVQYVGFWISDDVVQAQDIYLCNINGDKLNDPEICRCDGNCTGFPFAVEWTEWDGDVNKVVYTCETMVDAHGRELDLWALYRRHVINPDGAMQDLGKAKIAEYLEPGLTHCCWHETEEDVLVLEVAATVDVNETSSRYEIHPRALK